MRYTNAKVFTPEGFVHGGFTVEDGRFAEVFEGGRAGGADLGGACVIPGLVDIHTHGAASADFSDGDPDGLTRMAAHLAKCGVTSFAPTSMTLPYETLEQVFRTAVQLSMHRPDGCARVMGIHMEGPYFSEKKKGAQNGAFLKPPDLEGFRGLYEGCGGLIRIVDVAAELPGAAEFARGAKALCTVSVAHTGADYDEAAAVFDAGGVARLADGTIAGAASDLYADMLNAIRFGVDRDEAIRAATIRPAGEIGRADEIGSIEKGKLADFVVCGDDLTPRAVYIGGKKVS